MSSPQALEAPLEVKSENHASGYAKEPVCCVMRGCQMRLGAVVVRLTYNICSRCNALQLMCQPAEPLMREQVDSQLDLLPSECQSTCR